MMHPAQVVVAGHICIDVIPQIQQQVDRLDDLIRPGKLVNTGPLLLSTGGAVSNTGVALARLGVPTRLMGKIGDDLFGRAILDVLQAVDPALTETMIIDPAVDSSYTIIINPPGIDRSFLHCPGANDAFGADDVDPAALAGARIFHFGYPPIMGRMFHDDGRELERLLKSVRALGMTVSLDMALPDPDSPAGRADWESILSRALPQVDIFLPSLEETVYMLDRARFAAVMAEGPAAVDGAYLGRLADRLLSMGAAVAGLKLGEHGLYLKTTDSIDRLRACGAAGPSDVVAWCGREVLAPCFAVDVHGTTGAGDCTIAGFLAGLLHGLSLHEAVTAAVAVGAFSVESPDATGDIPAWALVQERARSTMPRRPSHFVDLP